MNPSKMPLARTPTPYPDDEPSLWDRLLGRRKPERFRPPPPPASSGAEEDAEQQQQQSQQQPLTSAQKRSLRRNKLARSPTPYPDNKPSKLSSFFGMLTGHGGGSSARSSSSMSSSSSASSSAASGSLPGSSSRSKPSLARSPTPYPEDHSDSSWWSSLWASSSSQSGKPGHRRKKRSGPSSPPTTAQVVILRKEPLRSASGSSAASLERLAAAGASTPPGTLTRERDITIVDPRDKPPKVDKGKQKEHRAPAIRIVDDRAPSVTHSEPNGAPAKLSQNHSSSLVSVTPSVDINAIEAQFEEHENGACSSSIASASKIPAEPISNRLSAEHGTHLTVAAAPALSGE
ncbi:hypothetical protein RI367_005927 [Sorochytrium milnesiophthora]